MGWDAALRHTGQAMALFLVAPLLIVGLALVVVFHDVLDAFTPDTDFVIVLVSLLSLGGFIGLMVLVYKFVKTQGFGLFRLTR